MGKTSEQLIELIELAKKELNKRSARFKRVAHKRLAEVTHG